MGNFFLISKLLISVYLSEGKETAHLHHVVAGQGSLAAPLKKCHWISKISTTKNINIGLTSVQKIDHWYCILNIRIIFFHNKSYQLDVFASFAILRKGQTLTQHRIYINYCKFSLIFLPYFSITQETIIFYITCTRLLFFTSTLAISFSTSLETLRRLLFQLLTCIIIPSKEWYMLR